MSLFGGSEKSKETRPYCKIKCGELEIEAGSPYGDGANLIEKVESAFRQLVLEQNELQGLIIPNTED